MNCDNCGSPLEPLKVRVDILDGVAALVPYWGCSFCGGEVYLQATSDFNDWVKEYNLEIDEDEEHSNRPVSYDIRGRYSTTDGSLIYIDEE